MSAPTKPIRPADEPADGSTDDPIRSFGPVNGPMIGIVMKELVRRAIAQIRAERFVFEASAKIGKAGQLDDMVTSADRAAQRVYVKLLKECFPDYGIVAEEDTLSVPCKLKDRDIFFTVDPLDGTKAFVRRQSHGIGTMLALVDDGEVVAACIGDVMTQELYYFRPGSQKVHRISEFGKAERLQIDEARSARSQMILLRDEPEFHTDFCQALVRRQGGAFKAPESASGSIGTSIARLWKGEVGAAILPPGPNEAWDLAPVLGISKSLGFVFMALEDRLALQEIPAQRAMVHFEREMLLVHKSRLDELRAWENKSAP